MTDLTFNNVRDYSQLNDEGQPRTNAFQGAAKAIFPAKTDAERQTSFLDAWLLSNNGQG